MHSFQGGDWVNYPQLNSIKALNDLDKAQSSRCSHRTVAMAFKSLFVFACLAVAVLAGKNLRDYYWELVALTIHYVYFLQVLLASVRSILIFLKDARVTAKSTITPNWDSFPRNRTSFRTPAAPKFIWNTPFPRMDPCDTPLTSIWIGSPLASSLSRWWIQSSMEPEVK